MMEPFSGGMIWRRWRVYFLGGRSECDGWIGGRTMCMSCGGIAAGLAWIGSTLFWLVSVFYSIIDALIGLLTAAAGRTEAREEDMKRGEHRKQARGQEEMTRMSDLATSHGYVQ